MKENNDIAGLFRSHLGDAKMEVRDDFWAELEQDLNGTVQHIRPLHFPWLRRLAAAASVALVLGVVSAAFWYLSPREEMGEAFDKIAVLAPETGLKGDWVQEKLPSIYQAASSPSSQQPLQAWGQMSAESAPDGDEQVAVRVSITITQQVHGKRRGSNGFYSSAGLNNVHQSRSDNADGRTVEAQEAVTESTPATSLPEKEVSDTHKWALKAGIGTSIPKENFSMPLTVGLGAEYCINRHLSLETGLQYNRLEGEQTLHTLSVPLRLNVMLATTSRVDLYAMAGGAVEKCIAGASDNGFDAEPVQLSVTAGLGMRYKLNQRFALFAEPTVSHYFDTASQTRTLRTERPLNLNLLCGVRMTY